MGRWTSEGLRCDGWSQIVGVGGHERDTLVEATHPLPIGSLRDVGVATLEDGESSLLGDVLPLVLMPPPQGNLRLMS